ncbi:MAG: hypothetical protein ACOYKZ_06640 [Chlamydiia bacterium]
MSRVPSHRPLGPQDAKFGVDGLPYVLPPPTGSGKWTVQIAIRDLHNPKRPPHSITIQLDKTSPFIEHYCQSPIYTSELAKNPRKLLDATPEEREEFLYRKKYDPDLNQFQASLSLVARCAQKCLNKVRDVNQLRDGGVEQEIVKALNKEFRRRVGAEPKHGDKTTIFAAEMVQSRTKQGRDIYAYGTVQESPPDERLPLTTEESRHYVQELAQGMGAPSEEMKKAFWNKVHQWVRVAAGARALRNGPASPDALFNKIVGMGLAVSVDDEDRLIQILNNVFADPVFADPSVRESRVELANWLWAKVENALWDGRPHGLAPGAEADWRDLLLTTFSSVMPRGLVWAEEGEGLRWEELDGGWYPQVEVDRRRRMALEPEARPEIESGIAKTKAWLQSHPGEAKSVLSKMKLSEDLHVTVPNEQRGIGAKRGGIKAFFRKIFRIEEPPAKEKAFMTPRGRVELTGRVTESQDGKTVAHRLTPVEMIPHLGHEDGGQPVIVPSTAKRLGRLTSARQVRQKEGDHKSFNVAGRMNTTDRVLEMLQFISEELWDPTLQPRGGVSSSPQDRQDFEDVVHALRQGWAAAPTAAESLDTTIRFQNQERHLPQGMSFAVDERGRLRWKEVDGQFHPVLRMKVQVLSLLSGSLAASDKGDRPDWSPVTGWERAGSTWRSVTIKAVRFLTLGISWLVERGLSGWMVERQWSEQEAASLAVVSKMTKQDPLILHGIPVEVEAPFTGIALNRTAEHREFHSEIAAPPQKKRGIGEKLFGKLFGGGDLEILDELSLGGVGAILKDAQERVKQLNSQIGEMSLLRKSTVNTAELRMKRDQCQALMRLGYTQKKVPQEAMIAARFMLAELLGYRLIIHCKSGKDRTGLALAIGVAVWNFNTVRPSALQDPSLKGTDEWTQRFLGIFSDPIFRTLVAQAMALPERWAESMAGTRKIEVSGHIPTRVTEVLPGKSRLRWDPWAALNNVDPQPPPSPGRRHV